MNETKMPVRQLAQGSKLQGFVTFQRRGQSPTINCATTRMNGDVDSISKMSANTYAKFLLPTHPETPSM